MHWQTVINVQRSEEVKELQLIFQVGAGRQQGSTTMVAAWRRTTEIETSNLKRLNC